MVQQRTDALEVAAPPYTLSCEPACEERVAQDLSRLATGIDSEVGDALRALVLTGPFARGEGGMIERDGEVCAAPPGYQLLAFFRRRPERHARALHMMGATWSRLLRAPVAIRALAEDTLAAAPASRFWYHAGLGQTLTLVGDPNVIRSLPKRSAALLREDEAARALCEGLLLLALASLDTRSAIATRIARTHRGVLLCADAWLLRRGRYAASLRERARDLQSLHAGAAMRAGYNDAIRFHERPDTWQSACDPDAFVETTRRWLSAWYLDYEAAHTGTLRDPLGYASDPRALLSAWGVHSASPRGYGMLWPSRGSRGYFLGRMLRAGVLLAFAPNALRCRLEAARILELPTPFERSISNEALARALCALAVEALADPAGEPFASLPSVPGVR